VANSISQRIEHKIWEVNEQLDAVIGDPASEEFVNAVLALLTPEEHTAYVREAVSFWIASDLEDIFDDGRSCEEHVAQYREQNANAESATVTTAPAEIADGNDSRV